MLGFRVWSCADKEMIRHEKFNINCDGIFMQRANKASESLYIPMQSTGLKDKNGTMIFEGDILLIAKPPEVYCECYEIVENVIDFLSCVYSGQPQKDLVHEYEIIGNVYEHPQLLDKIK